VALGFQAILKLLANAAEPYGAIGEDDIVFAACAEHVFASGEFRALIQGSGLLGEQPTLIRLGRPSIDKKTFLATGSPGVPLRVSDEVVMSNYFFIVNRAFARLAAERLNQIDHTADVIIHAALLAQARCVTLNIQMAGDRSWSLGEVPSLIHPKAHHLAYLRWRHGESSREARDEAERLQGHLKKAVSRTYCVTGSPRCGSHFVSAFLGRNGLDIGHESLGRDGICAWQYAVSSDRYPYISDRQAQSDFFVHADTWFLYARDPVSALPSLIVENQKGPLSYAFRREAIYKDSGVNLDDFASPVEKAARSYAHWYLLALKRKPKAVLRVENFLEDCRRHIPGHRFEPVEISAAERGAGKPYLGVVHPPVSLPGGWMEAMPNGTLDLLRDVANRLGYSL
jgi:hypothetical protein